MKRELFKSILILFVSVAGILSAVATTYIVTPEDCTDCGLCIESCPVEAISEVEYEGKTVAMIDAKLCTGCGLCEENCPVEAISENSEEVK